MRAEVEVGDRSVTVVQPEDVDAVIEMYIKQGRLDRDPYWCRLWPSAIALAEEIFARPQLVAGRRVCDLGAGLGLAGLAAAMAGAREVVLYDREPAALRCALLTAHTNLPALASNLPEFSPAAGRPPPPAPRPAREEPAAPPSAPAGLPRVRATSAAAATPAEASPAAPSATTAQVGGGQDHLPAGSPAWGRREGGGAPLPRLRAELFDWSDPGGGSADFDVVLCCDVLYEDPSVALIADLIPRLLHARKGATLLVGDPLERKPRNRAAFLDLMQGRASSSSHGLVLDLMERRAPAMDGSVHQVEVMQFSIH